MRLMITFFREVSNVLRKIASAYKGLNRQWRRFRLFYLTIVFSNHFCRQFTGLFNEVVILRKPENVLTMKIFAGIPAVVIDRLDFALSNQNENFVNLKPEQRSNLINRDPGR